MPVDGDMSGTLYHTNFFIEALFARVFYSLEKDLAKLADILGHSSIDTTRIYIVSSGLEHRRKLEQMRLLV